MMFNQRFRIDRGAIELDNVRGDIEFQDVYFAYEKGRNVLEEINLSVKAGESVAILGPTGSGKSTLIYLIPRFYDVTSGSITLDGRDIRDYKLESLRRQVGVVLQDVFLFSLTMRENIAFGRPDATMEEVVEAAKAAQADDFISALPKGYETSHWRARGNPLRRPKTEDRDRSNPADEPEDPDI